MENVMRVLWHLNAELGSLYEVKTMTEALLKEADDLKNALASLPPDSGEAEFAADELRAAATSLRETETALHALRQKLGQSMPKEGAEAK